MAFPLTDTSKEVVSIKERLLKVPVGEVITYEDLNETVGRDLTNRRYVVLNAIRMANKEGGAIFTSVRGVGYKRLTIEEAPNLGILARQRIRRAARTAAHRIANAASRANDIDPHTSRRIYAEMSTLGLVEELARQASHGAMERAVEEVDTALPPAKAAQTFLDFLRRK